MSSGPASVSRDDGSPAKKHGWKQHQKCDNCYVRASQTVLKTCSKCKSAGYCSRDCQVSDWKQHKVVCEAQAGHAEDVVKADADPMTRLLLPPGVNFAEIERRFSKWIKFHTAMLISATIHALDLPRDITRTRTHILFVRAMWRLDHNDEPGKYFRVISAEVMELSEARNKSEEWRTTLDHIDTMRKESERMRRGTIAVMTVDYPPIGLQHVPFASLKFLDGIPPVSNWREVMKRDAESGKKFTRFGS